MKARMRERASALTTGNAPAPDQSLREVRDRIAEVDGDIVELIALRCRLVTAAGEHKRCAGDPIQDPRQEAAVVRRGAERARAAGIPDEEVVREIFWRLIGLSRRVQAASRREESGHASRVAAGAAVPHDRESEGAEAGIQPLRRPPTRPRPEVLP